MQFSATVLYVDDVFTTVDFYQRAFGMKVRFSDHELGFVEMEAGTFLLAVASHPLGEMLMPGKYPRPADGRPAGVELAFLTNDVPAAYEKAIGAGATPLAAPKKMPWGLEVAYALAPEGSLLGFSEPPLPAGSPDS